MFCKPGKNTICGTISPLWILWIVHECEGWQILLEFFFRNKSYSKFNIFSLQNIQSVMVSAQCFALSICVEIFGFFTVDAKEPFACYVKRNVCFTTENCEHTTIMRECRDQKSVKPHKTLNYKLQTIHTMHHSHLHLSCQNPVQRMSIVI